MRTAAFLLSKTLDRVSPSKASALRRIRSGTGVKPSLRLGDGPIDLEEFLRLQAIVIGDARFVKLDLREEGGFVGEHDRDTRMPIPDHISARPGDLSSLIDGMVAFDQGPAQGLDPVIAAAALAFGFVYVHPFVDGNGRIHRYLIHHVLAQRGFNPSGVVFPISAAILERIDDYRAVLENYSRRLLPVIDWRPAGDGNIEVLNQTADFYRFFDTTPQAEFLYACVRQTIEEDLPRETRFLLHYDQFRNRIEAIVDMPDRTIDLLFRFLHQNGGQLTKRAREQEFVQLTDVEAAAAEDAYKTGIRK